jgi:hypothetical protein
MDGLGRLDRQTASWPIGYLKVPAEHDTNKKFLFCFSAEEQEEETDDEDDNGSDDLDEDDNLMSPASLIHLEDSVGPGNVRFFRGKLEFFTLIVTEFMNHSAY